MLQPVAAPTSLPPFQASSAFLASSSSAALEPFTECQLPPGLCQSRTTSGSSSSDHQQAWSASQYAENDAVDCKTEPGAPIWPPAPPNQLWSHDLVAYVPYPYPSTPTPNYLSAGQKAIKCQVRFLVLLVNARNGDKKIS
ncbi:unnamed protein product [Dibothriocephalus latus]|uniref:Uncharacterized protein n=1 Tax=Dibothriocephalus latus TaxID=60516 RepID=A0A3P6Q5Y3_DIBLA|nr:unnamed protein product [Dibothriocephalus latus]